MAEEGTDGMHLLVWHSAWSLSFPSDRQETHSTFLGKKKDIVTYSLSDGDCHVATGQVIKLNKWPALPANMWEKVTHSRPLFIYLFFQKTELALSHSNSCIWSSCKSLISKLRNLYQKMHFFADCQISAPALMPHSWRGKVFNHSVPPPTIIQLPFS